jgi:hypothetical protein
MKFQGRGNVYLYTRNDDGSIGPGVFVGCSDELPIKFAVDKFEHIERCSGNDSIDFTGTKKKSGDGTLTLTEITPENLALALNGNIVPAGGTGSVTGEDLPDGIVAGNTVILGGSEDPHGGITSLTITGLVAGTDYELNSVTGTVTFLTDPTGPLSAAYHYDDGAYVNIFTAPEAERWLRFDYKNKADQFKRGVVDLYRCRFEPTSDLPLITDELMTLQLNFAILVDTTKSDTGPLGQFGRITNGVLPPPATVMASEMDMDSLPEMSAVSPAKSRAVPAARASRESVQTV